VQNLLNLLQEYAMTRTGLRSCRENDTAPTGSGALLFMKMAPALAPELWVFMTVAPATELFFSWLRLRTQLWLLFVFTHYHFQLSWCASSWMGSEIYEV